jgi:hypothetical protein
MICRRNYFRLRCGHYRGALASNRTSDYSRERRKSAEEASRFFLVSSIDLDETARNVDKPDNRLPRECWAMKGQPAITTDAQLDEGWRTDFASPQH